MTQGELEKIPAEFEKIMRKLETRIMGDMVRRIREAGFSTASADWQFTRLRQLGMSEEQIKKWVKEVLKETDEQIEKIYSDDTYQEYMKQARGYEVYGQKQIPFEDNIELQELIEAVKQQTADEFRNITGSMGFVKEAMHGKQHVLPLKEFYIDTLDSAAMDIHSGAFDYRTVVGRAINDMTKSGLRWIDYESGWHNRVPVAARRAIMTGFRQVQGKINEQTARDLHTDSYEVTVHIGARPTHQVWEGKVWTMEQLKTVCGLGTGPGLHGWNCYHDYNCFIPGVSVRTYTDEQLDKIHAEENEKKEYLGKEYTTYEALQRQRQLETRARKYREDVHLLEESKEGIPDDQAAEIDKDIEAKKSRYQGILQEYKAFSKKMGLPMQKERIYQDGLKVKMNPKKVEDVTDAESKSQTKGYNSKSGARARTFSDIGETIRTSSKKVFYSEENDYSLTVEGLNSNVNESLSEIARDLAKKGSQDGLEHMCLVNLETGAVEHEEKGDETSVGIDFWDYAKNNPNSQFVYIHNHNYVSSLSETDLTTPVLCQNIPIMIAVQNDGVSYVARRIKDSIKGYYPDFYFEEELKELNKKSRNGMISPTERMKERETIIIQNLVKTFYGGRVDCFE